MAKKQAKPPAKARSRKAKRQRRSGGTAANIRRENARLWAALEAHQLEESNANLRQRLREYERKAEARKPLTPLKRALQALAPFAEAAEDMEVKGRQSDEFVGLGAITRRHYSAAAEVYQALGGDPDFFRYG